MRYILERVILKVRKGIAILGTGLNLRINSSKGSGSWMPVSKPSAARRKPKASTEAPT